IVVHPAAAVAGDHTHEGAKRASDQHGGAGDDQRDSRPCQHPAEEILPELVHAEWVGAAHSGQWLPHPQRPWIVGRERWPEDAEHDEPEQHQQPEYAERVIGGRLRQPAADAAPALAAGTIETRYRAGRCRHQLYLTRGSSTV